MQSMIGFVKHIFGMPLPVRLWVAALFLTNLGGLFFLDHVEALVVLAALFVGGMAQTAIFASKGFVRLMGVGHFHWLPMLYWLYTRLEAIQTDSALYAWIVAVMVFDGISLLIDVADVGRYVRGDRQPLAVLS